MSERYYFVLDPSIQSLRDHSGRAGWECSVGQKAAPGGERGGQSLAGRVSINTLLPLSIEELKKAHELEPDPSACIYRGTYPPTYARSVPPTQWYPSYIKTYLERDLRDLTVVEDLAAFKKFMALCAGRAGQLLNIASLAIDANISETTTKRWLSLLETSYIIFLLQPYHVNYNKRVIKSPKLYFFDTGLICSLLSIEQEQIVTHYMRGALFENLVVSDLYKQFCNHGKNPTLYFWRDQTGHEIDVLVQKHGALFPIEIKASATPKIHFFDENEYWNALSKNNPANSTVIFAGTKNQTRSKGTLLSWHTMGKFI